MRTTDRGGRFLAFLVCVVLLAGSLSVSALADEFAATTMKLASAEGTVKVTNGLGRSIKTFAGMNLNNGYHVVTDTKSSAKINMDDTKLATMDELSDVDISKQDGDLELRLNAGDVFVAVNQKIEKTQTVKIRSANVVMGITGTLLCARANEDGGMTVTFGEGSGSGAATDPVSGESVQFSLKQGQKAVLNVFAIPQNGHKIKVSITGMTQIDVMGSMAVAALADADILARLKAGLGDSIDPTNASLFQSWLDQIAKNAATQSDNGTSGVQSQYAAAESELAAAEAEAAADHHDHHHHHHDDDDEEGCSHEWGVHTLPAINVNTAGGALTGTPASPLTVTVECTKCHRTAHHTVDYNVIFLGTTSGSGYYSQYAADWTCRDCHASGRTILN